MLEFPFALRRKDIIAMNIVSTSAASGQGTHERSVQTYIDETPVWADGTTVQSTPLTAMQWRIWTLATAGKFFEGLVVFMTGVALPLIAEEFDITGAQHGIIGAASLFGILIGAIGLGGPSDYFGRKAMFIVEMIIFTIFLCLLVMSSSYIWLVVFLFGLGVALGCDYPTAHLVISESIPSSMRGRLVLGAFAFQAIGALTGTVIGYLVLKNIPEIGAWRWMYATAIIPALLVIIGRFSITESAHWLLLRDRKNEAQAELARLLARNPAYPKKVLLTRPDAAQVERNFLALFNKDNIRATVLASIPWFLQDLGTYGIGIFTPTILAASIGHKTTHVRSLTDLINNDVLAAKGAGLIDLLLIVGIVCAILLVNKIGSIRLQIWGFIGCGRGAGDRRLFRLRHRRTKVLPDLRGLHGVQFHDQPWAELSNLPYCRRGVSDAGSRHGRRLRSSLRKGRRSRDCVSISDPARRYRNPGAAVHPCRGLVPWRDHHLAFPGRHDRR
jgi:MFS family permease